MAGLELSSAKILLLAVRFASTSDTTSFRVLLSRYPKTLHLELALRILLSFLPESLPPSEYVSLLQSLTSESLDAAVDGEASIDSSTVGGLSDRDSKKNIRKLHLLPLLWPNAPEDSPTEPLVRFLIHRSLRIDQFTGMTAQIPQLLVPFLPHSTYIRTWLISTILPLLRLNYEYYPDDPIDITIPKFETLLDSAGVALLLSKSSERKGSQDSTIARDVRGLVGPWLYGDNTSKRRKLRQSSVADLGIIPILGAPTVPDKYTAWDEVFKWLVSEAQESWTIAIELVEHWDGPGDVDLGGYEDGSLWLDEEDQQYLEQRFARSILACAYQIPDGSTKELEGIQRLLARIITLLDKDRIPTLEAACALLSPVSGLSRDDALSSKNLKYLRGSFLESDNVLTTPKDAPLKLLHTLLVSAFLCTRIGCEMSIRRAGELALMQERQQQEFQFNKHLIFVTSNPKDEDRFWIRMRNEILWLRNWGLEELSEGADAMDGRGIFGQLPRQFIEVGILKGFLANSRFSLARSIYENSPEPPLDHGVLHDTVIASAMSHYDNASNPNRKRGGVKLCDETLQAFKKSLASSEKANQVKFLLKVTGDIAPYRLVMKKGEPFKPVSLRIHDDPISILGKILEQNPGSYTNIGDFVEISKNMVQAGLTDKAMGSKVLSEDEQLSIAQKRVVSMCIDSALSEDDFETAYSYVSTRLKDIGGQAYAKSPPATRTNSASSAAPPPKVLDDWSWRAALQAGKYRRTAQTIKPTHLGNSPANLEIRHLEQRMDCLSHALRMAPRGTLQEIINVYRRCEEELESLVKHEAEEEEVWDAQGDDTLMPGSFAATLAKHATSTNTSRGVEEAPMSLFDLSRASMARAQSGFSALSMLRGSNPQGRLTTNDDGEASMTASTESLPARTRKRDQLKNAAVGGLASGVGWLLGAQPVQNTSDEERT